MPDPLVEIAVEPKNRAAGNKLLRALVEFTKADPSLRVTTDAESGQTIVSGVNEEHVCAALDQLQRNAGMDLMIGAPQVAYRETITQAADVDHTYKKQIGGAGEIARVKLHLEPLPRGSGISFESQIVGSSVPMAYVPGVEQGVRALLDSGVLAGFPVIDIKVALIDGTYHQEDSSALTFEIAARAAMREALTKAAPQLLEPTMNLDVRTPLANAADVLSDIRRRRGTMASQNQDGDILAIGATVLLANMFGYAKFLGTLTNGRGTFAMAFSHYTPVPLPSPDDQPFPPAIGMRV